MESQSSRQPSCWSWLASPSRNASISIALTSSRCARSPCRWPYIALYTALTIDAVGAPLASRRCPGGARPPLVPPPRPRLVPPPRPPLVPPPRPPP
eukprot:scaffold77457_cov66-Phaeocystis_antarctica.AAC.9